MSENQKKNEKPFDETIANNDVLENDETNQDLNAIMNEFSVSMDFTNEGKSIEKLLENLEGKLRHEEAMLTLLEVMKTSQAESLERVTQPHFENIVEFNDTKDKHLNESTSSSNKEFYLSIEVAKKILDYQFVARKKIIHNQRDKSLQDVVHLKKQFLYKDDLIFVPSVTNDYFSLMGLSRVVDILKNEDIDEKIDIPICANCSTSVSPLWKKKKTENDIFDIMCSECSITSYQADVRKEYESLLEKTKQQFEEQERILVRDYQDMLSHPKKMELFRYEQEKRQKIQDMSSNHSIPIKSSESINLCPKQSNTTIYLRPESEGSKNPSAYVQILRALASHTSNPDATMDKDYMRKLQQVLILLQSNPLLANNNAAVLQLLANICGLQSNESINVSSVINSMIDYPSKN